MSRFQVTFKGEVFDITVAGDNAHEIVEEYNALRNEIVQALGPGPAKQQVKLRELHLMARPAASSGLPVKIVELIGEGFFDSNRKLQEIQDNLRKKGVTKPVTTIAARLTELVRKGSLERDYETVNNKKFWVYRRRRSQ